MPMESRIISSVYDASAHLLMGAFLIVMIAEAPNNLVLFTGVPGLLFIIIYFLGVVKFVEACAMEDPKADFYKSWCTVHSYLGYLFCSATIFSLFYGIFK